MKKRIISVLLVLVLTMYILPVVATASGGLSNFVRVNTYSSGRFTDIATSKWYAASVQTAYEYGLVDGKTQKTFEPEASLTIAEAIKLAACLHSIYHSGSEQFSNGTPWYRPYIDYALENGIIATEYTNYDAEVTRSEFAVILAGALPAEALTVRNTIGDNAIPDVLLGFTYSDAVYTLYRAGILTGVDTSGSFMPNNNIKRAEVAAIVTRMANASFRQRITLSLNLTTVQIFNQCAPAVFYITIYDIKNTAIKTGSGFFISSSGLAVTNYHVVSGASKAVITTYDGKEYDVTGVYEADKDKDIALLQVGGSGFAYLSMADSDQVETGAEAFAIGSPLGYKNTISQGIISAASRMVEGKNFIQTTAAISSGSSGGALLNASGQVIGVTTATAVGAQNINLAVPINELKSLQTTTLKPVSSLMPTMTYYNGHFPAPDFGAYTNTPLYKTETIGDAVSYYYRVSDMPKTIEDALSGYSESLEQNVFTFYGYAIESGKIITYYMNGAYGLLVTFGETTLDGTDCIRVQIMSF